MFPNLTNGDLVALISVVVSVFLAVQEMRKVSTAKRAAEEQAKTATVQVSAAAREDESTAVLNLSNAAQTLIAPYRQEVDFLHKKIEDYQRAADEDRKHYREDIDRIRAELSEERLARRRESEDHLREAEQLRVSMHDLENLVEAQKAKIANLVLLTEQQAATIQDQMKQINDSRHRPAPAPVS